MKLSIVIPVFNNWNFTRACLDDLSHLVDTEIVVVDNGSTDETAKLPDSLKMGKNLGFAKACNAGYAKSQGEYVLFLNNDIRVQKDKATWANLLTEAAADGSLTGPTGGLLDEHLNFIRETNGIVPGHFYMSGWCLCAKRDVFDKLILEENEFAGPFTEEFTTYYEDVDLSFRAIELNIPLVIVSVPVHHFGKITSKTVGLSKLYVSAHTKFVNKWKAII